MRVPYVVTTECVPSTMSVHAVAAVPSPKLHMNELVPVVGR